MSDHDPAPEDESVVDPRSSSATSTTSIEAWAKVFDLMSDPTRLRLLLRIHFAGPIRVSDLAEQTGIREGTVSQALRVLRAAEAVSTERDGRSIYYSLADPVIHDLLHRLVGDDPHAH